MIKKILIGFAMLAGLVGCSDEDSVVQEFGNTLDAPRPRELYTGNPIAEVTYVDDESGYILYEAGADAREEFRVDSMSLLGAFRTDNGYFIPCLTGPRPPPSGYAKKFGGSYVAALQLAYEWDINYNPNHELWTEHKITLYEGWYLRPCGDTTTGGPGQTGGMWDAKSSYGTVSGAADKFNSVTIYLGQGPGTGNRILRADVVVDVNKIRSWACNKGLIPSCTVWPTQGAALNVAFNIEKYAWAKGWALAMGWVHSAGTQCPATGTDVLIHTVVPTAANCWNDPDPEGSYYSNTTPDSGSADPYFLGNTGYTLVGEL